VHKMIDMDKEGTERVCSLITECSRGTRYTQKKCSIGDHNYGGIWTLVKNHYGGIRKRTIRQYED